MLFPSPRIIGQEHDRDVIKTEVETGTFVKKGSGQLFIMNGLSGDEFINTYMGKPISYTINFERLTTLAECCQAPETRNQSFIGQLDPCGSSPGHPVWRHFHHQRHQR